MARIPLSLQRLGGGLAFGPQQVDQSSSPPQTHALQGSSTFGMVFRESDADLSGGHVPSKAPIGGAPAPMSEAETHRYIQSWWLEHENRIKQRAADANLKKPVAKPVKTPNKPLSHEIERKVRGDIEESVQEARAAHLALQEFGLSHGDVTAIMTMLDDDFLEENP